MSGKHIVELLAPQLDKQLLFQLLDFHEAKGLDVKAARDEVNNALRDELKPFGNPDDHASWSKKIEKLRDRAKSVLEGFFVQDQESQEYHLTFSDKDLDTMRRGQFRELVVPPRPLKSDVQVREVDMPSGLSDAEKTAFLATTIATLKEEAQAKKVEPLVAQKKINVKTLPNGAFEVTTDITTGIAADALDALLDLGSISHRIGLANQAVDILKLCSMVVVEDGSRDEAYITSSLWGLLASSLSANRWHVAEEAIKSLRRKVFADRMEEETKTYDVLADRRLDTRARSWLLHWGLFLFFKGGESKSEELLRLVFDYQNSHVYRKVIETVAPQLIRYVVAAALANRDRSALYNAMHMIKNMYEYSDALTSFVDTLIRQCDLEGALELLPSVEALARDDYFLNDRVHLIMEGARKVLFESYLKTHSAVSIAMMKSYLASDMDDAAAEVWIANLLRESRLVAKIDSVEGLVLVSASTRDVHEAILFDINKSS